ncbi:right-handed parallel beta-helix repeat-containing protein [Mycobacterium sp.]|uniref:right-handed parallel beta-helix repeat-containing protein n=1 Tax=Mycobacterium sp. TaxID=1785 RepID=UPI003341DD18
MFDALKPGATLYIPPGTYQHSGNLYIRVPNVTIYGDNSTFVATNPSTSALYIQANGVKVQDLLLSGSGGSLPQGGPSAAGLVMGYDGVTVKHVSIIGMAGLGIYIPGATNFVLDTVYVANTASDGIQISAGANHGQLSNIRVQNTGDDSIAIVSYSTDKAPVSNIVVNSPVVINSTQTRGIAVVGGQNITFNNIFVQNTALSGFFVGSQVFTNNQGAVFSTMSVSGVTVNGGTITGANFATGLPLGAITVLNQNPNATVSNVTISGVSIVNPYTPGFNIGNGTLDGGGPVSNIVYRNIAITESPVRQIIYNTVPGSYTATGFTMNGKPVVVT